MNRPPVDSSDPPLDREEISAMVREALRQQIGGHASGEDSGPPAVDESAKDVITEADMRDVPAGARFIIREDAIITPAARDLMRERGVEIRYRERRSVASKRRLIAVGADHGGYEMKERLKDFLDELGYRHRDFGTFSEEAVDYPDFAHAVARAGAGGARHLGLMGDSAGSGAGIRAR